MRVFISYEYGQPNWEESIESHSGCGIFETEDLSEHGLERMISQDRCITCYGFKVLCLTLLPEEK